MKNTDPLLESLGEAYGYVQQYIDQRIELLKLETAERSSGMLASFLTLFAVFFLVLVLLALLTVTAALFIGQALGGNYPLGFLIMTGVYALLALLIYVFRRPLLTDPILSMVISKIFPPADDIDA